MSVHPLQTAIEACLRRCFVPRHLTVTDISESHRGHAGWREGGGTHFAIEMHSSRFVGESRVHCHRMVHESLAEAGLLSRIHALTLSLHGDP